MDEVIRKNPNSHYDKDISEYTIDNNSFNDYLRKLNKDNVVIITNSILANNLFEMLNERYFENVIKLSQRPSKRMLESYSNNKYGDNLSEAWSNVISKALI